MDHGSKKRSGESVRRVEIVSEQARRHHLGWLVGKPSGSETRNRGKLKWAASQEAVTFPWLSAHSILNGSEVMASS